MRARTLKRRGWFWFRFSYNYLVQNNLLYSKLDAKIREAARGKYKIVIEKQGVALYFEQEQDYIFFQLQFPEAL